jgi:hypothetical protein
MTVKYYDMLSIVINYITLERTLESKEKKRLDKQLPIFTFIFTVRFPLFTG